MKKIYLLALTGLMAYGAHAQNVGVGTNDPKTKMDINGGLSLRAGQDITTLVNGNNDNVVLPDVAGSAGVKSSFYRIVASPAPNAPFTILGIAPTNGADGQVVTLINTTGQAMTIKNNSSSTPANGFITLTGSDYVSVAGNSSITIQYNKTSARWYVTGSQNFTVTTGSIATGDITTTNNAITLTNNTGRLVGTANMTVDVKQNDLGQKGIVPGPNGGNAYQVWGTDNTGAPAWQKVNNNQLTNNSVTVNTGTGLSGGGNVALGGTLNLTNTGVTSITAGTNVTISGGTGNVTINSTSGISGASTQNYLPKWTTTNGTTGTLSSTSSVYDNGNVGIGNTSPATAVKLDVTGSIKADFYEATGGGGFYSFNTFWNGGWFQRNNGFGAVIRFEPGTGTAATARTQFFYTGNGTAGGAATMTEGMVLNNVGNLGIGNGAPQHLLSVGTVSADAQLVTIRGYSNIAAWKGGAAFGYTSASVIMGELSGVAQLGGHSATLNAWADLAINLGGGNVGIGTTTPGYKLDVNGAAGVGYLVVKPQDNAFEGGEIQMVNTTGAKTFNIDNYDGNARIHTLTAGRIFQVVGGAGVGITALAGTGIRMATVDAGGVLGVQALPGGVLPSGTTGQTLYNNSGTWTATSNLYNNGTTVSVGTSAAPGLFSVNGNTVVGTGLISRSAIGLTVSTNDAYAFAANTDVGDGHRTISLVNENSAAGNMVNLAMRVNPNTGNNQMLDLKFVNPNDGTSKLVYSFAPGGAFTDRFVMTSAGSLGIGVASPVARLEVAGGNQSVKVGVTGNMANSNVEVLNSLSVLGANSGAISGLGATAWDFYNNGTPSWSGSLLQHYGTTYAGNVYGLPAASQGVLVFQNVANGVVATNGAPIHISPLGNVSTTFLTNGNVGIGTQGPGAKLDVAGNIRAINGNNPTVSAGSTSVDGMLFDLTGNYRPGMVVRGTYPHMELWSDVSNSNHGPTLRFGGYDNGSSGAYKHWVIGTAGSNLNFMDFGYAANDPNPHVGIAGFSTGKTVMRLYSNGNVGIGNFGAFGTVGLEAPAYKLDVQGNAGVGYLHVKPENSGVEGGEIQLMLTDASKNLQIDNLDGNLRIHTLTAGRLFQVIGGNGINITALSGGGSRMVTVDNGGTLGATAMPGGVLPAGSIGQTLYHNGTSWTATSNLTNSGSNIKLGQFTDTDADEWPYVTWLQTGSWDEGLIKGDHNKGAWGRAGFGIHMHSSRHFGFFSTGWDPLFDVEGGTGRTYIKGNVGIGTMNPGSKLSVIRTAGAGSNADVLIGDGTQWMQINSNSSGGSWTPMAVNNDHVIVYSNGSAETGGFTLAQWSGTAKGIRIDPSGNVGVGTSAPGAKLDVVGNIRAINGADPRVWAGATSTDGMLFDGGVGGNYRPALVARGTYPHLDLWADVANANHGATLRFGGYDNGSSGNYKHWVIGTPGSDLYFMDFGYAANTGNPHQGISGYAGLTTMRMTNSGNIGIGNYGTYGTGILQPAVKLDILHEGASTYGVAMRLYQYAVGNSDGPKLEFYKTMTSSKRWVIGMSNGVNVGDFNIAEDGGYNGGFGTQRLTILAGGNVGIGATSPGEKLDVDGLIRGHGYRCRTGQSGSFGNVFNINWASPYGQLWIDNVFVGNFFNASDRRLKSDIVELKDNAVDRVMALKPVSFKYKEVPGTIFHANPTTYEGFIADEIQQVIPSAVEGEKDGMTKDGTIQPQMLNYMPILSVLTKAIQEQQVEIEGLKNAQPSTTVADVRGNTATDARMDKLENQYKLLQEQLAAIQTQLQELNKKTASAAGVETGSLRK